MSYLQFPKRMDVRVIASSAVTDLGSFQPIENLELYAMRVKLFIKGTTGGTERARIKIFGESTRGSALYTSSWSTLSSITTLAANWQGWLRFDFNKENINKDIAYFLGIEIENYTRNGETYYISYALDNIANVYAATGSLGQAAIEIYGYTEGN